MCLIALALHAHAEFPLVLAANRDEFFARPSAALGFWPDAPQVLAGRDLQHGGTWLGLNRSGLWAAVTNFRDGARKASSQLSRGALVSEFLRGGAHPEIYLQALHSRRDRYAGFNLLLGIAADSVWHYSNVSGAITPVSSGVHGLSNGLLDTPWPKVRRANAGLAEALHESAAIPHARLFALLADHRRAADDELPHTGVSLEWERSLSSAFIGGLGADIGYGTRCSTVLLIDRTGHASMAEKIFDADGKLRNTESLELGLDTIVPNSQRNQA